MYFISDAWLQFGVVVLIQIFLLLSYAWYMKQLTAVPRALFLGVLIGVTIGVPFDLVFGKSLGLHSYELGFGIFFLVINATFSYGVFVANIFLLRTASWQHFYFAAIVIMTMYETINYFFRVWTWHFSLQLGLFVSVLLIGYVAGATAAALLAHKFLGQRFAFLEKVLKK